jgi:uncharacterized protein YjbJ (UPF0337 family)
VYARWTWLLGDTIRSYTGGSSDCVLPAHRRDAPATMAFDEGISGYFISTRPPKTRWKECLAMGLPDKIANTVQILRGRAKEAAGKMSNDPGLAMEGKLERGAGHIKQAGEKMKDAGRNLFRW